MQDITKVVDSLELKLNNLIERYTLLKSENNELTNRIAVLDRELQDKNQLLAEQDTTIKSLTIAKTIQGSDYSKETTRKINTLIKDIDWCISQLSD
ncbi:MAG: hypothetical protein CR968_03355 [Flavobacteriia bacterium]|nr:MAG: hypothetical protein CR968_03355 [Flavobacteriia bacterium]